jgi:hypothetical protein
MQSNEQLLSELNEPSCSNCRYFLFLRKNSNEKLSEESKGQCRKLPPVPLEAVNEGYLYSTQPEVIGDDWCGQHEPGTPASRLKK